MFVRFLAEKGSTGQEHSYVILRISKSSRNRPKSANSKFDHHVTPIADSVSSLTAISPAGAGPKEAVSFTTTHWSVVLEAQGESPAAQEALEKLCRTYWRSIYGFARRQGVRPEEVEDLTQGFFALRLERRDLNVVRKEKGRLRSYLLTSLKHFLTNERSRAMSIKRGEGQRLIPLEDLHERETAGFAATDISTAEQIYECGWALALLDQVLTRLGDEYRTAGPASARLFDQLQKLLTDESDCPSQAEIAGELGMTGNAVKQAFHRLRQRYREIVRGEIARTVSSPGEIEEEPRYLCNI